MFDITKKKAFVCDLDGTLFMGANPIKPAVDFVIESTISGRFKFFYLTNNTSKTPAQYMTKIAGANIPVVPEQI
jgi:ribonucleotide monophosphatase NagD (HAD superfamily)